MERDVKDKVQASVGYVEAYHTHDVLAVWLITEQVCVGRGAVSIYVLTARLKNSEKQ
jgi:hypothetical protein